MNDICGASTIHRGLLVLLILPMVGCSLFDTRPPETPITAGSSFEPPTTPTVVLRNLESALVSANAGDYRKCFSDTSQGVPSFVFLASSQGLANAPSTFANWSVGDEELYAQNIFAELRTGELATVTFTPRDVTGVPIADSVGFTASYIVRFPHTRTNVEQVAEGTLQFTFRQSRRNEWYISSWRDIVAENKTSWSVIKARFVNR